LSKNLGADPATFGQLQTVFAVAQLLGGPGKCFKAKSYFGLVENISYFILQNF
jgi:hypothetical protein